MNYMLQAVKKQEAISAHDNQFSVNTVTRLANGRLSIVDLTSSYTASESVDPFTCLPFTHACRRKRAGVHLSSGGLSGRSYAAYLRRALHLAYSDSLIWQQVCFLLIHIVS